MHDEIRDNPVFENPVWILNSTSWIHALATRAIGRVGDRENRIDDP